MQKTKRSGFASDRQNKKSDLKPKAVHEKNVEKKSHSAAGEYKFVLKAENYEDFSSGNVIYSLPGATSFPVRLASEIFQRCTDILVKSGLQPPFSLYDPCCGSAYLETVLGFLHAEFIQRIWASDIDEKMLNIAARNLSLLSLAGLQKREEEILQMYKNYGKKSHEQALEAIVRLREKLYNSPFQIETYCFRRDILRDKDDFKIDSVNVVISDVPYGKITAWEGKEIIDNPIQQMLINLKPSLSENSVVAIALDKRQPFSYGGYNLINKIKIGKRRVLFLRHIYQNENRLQN